MVKQCIFKDAPLFNKSTLLKYTIARITKNVPMERGTFNSVLQNNVYQLEFRS